MDGFQKRQSMNNPDTQGNDHAKTDEPTNENGSSFAHDVMTGLAFLSRLPIRLSNPRFSLARSSRAFGIVGLILGALSGAIFWLAHSVGLGTLPAVIVALALSALISGGLHEDGFADVADGFGGGWSKERKLEIMRDSQIGTYGVLALIFSVGFRITAYSSIIASQNSFITSVAMFAAIGCLSRSTMALMMYQLPLARKDGRAVDAGTPSHDNLRNGLFISAITGLLCLLVVVKTSAVIASFAGVAIAYLVVRKLAKSHIGGYTGDVLGALQQTTEIFILLALLLRI